MGCRVRRRCERQVALEYTLVTGVLARPNDSLRLACASANWAAVADLVGPVGRWMDRSAGTPVVDQRSSWVRRHRTSAGEFYVKVYQYDSWGNRLRNWGKWTAPWRPSRAQRECAAFAWLAANGFSSPAHFACFERRQAGFLACAAVATSSIPGISADRLLADSGPDQRARTARDIGAFVRRLHRAGFRDRNLDLRNLIVDGDRITKIDSPRHRIVRPGRRDDALARADWARLLPQLEKFGVCGSAEQGP